MPGGAVNTPIPLVSFTRDRDRPCFQTARFPEFWQSAIPTNEGKKTNTKTLGSCKPNAYWCANLTARARDRPCFHKNFAINLKSM